VPLKKFFAKRAIRQQIKSNSKRERVVSSISKGTRIGILFEAEETSSRQLMEKFREELVEQGALVSVLGHFPSKEFPEKLVFKPGFDYFKKKDTDWKDLAQESILHKFNNLNLDILIGAFTSENLLFLHFAAQSNAGFRIGPYLPNYTDCFDFMIDTQSNTELPNLVKLSTHYLKQLHP